MDALSPQQKIAVLQTGLAVIASMTNGRVRSNDPDVITLVRGIFGHSADESGFFPVFIHLSVQRAGYRRNGNSACFSDIFQLYHIPNIPFR